MFRRGARAVLVDLVEDVLRLLRQLVHVKPHRRVRREEAASASAGSATNATAAADSAAAFPAAAEALAPLLETIATQPPHPTRADDLRRRLRRVVGVVAALGGQSMLGRMTRARWRGCELCGVMV